MRKGESDINEAMITGESRPVMKREGDDVIAATISGEGSLRVEVTGTGEKTKLSGIMRLVADAQTSKSRAQHLADRAARLLTVVAIGAAAITLVVWQLLGAALDFSVVRLVTVLVIACPHALGLAVPLVVAISTTLGGPQRSSGAGPARTLGGPEPRHRDFRQDRNVDAGRVSGRSHVRHGGPGGGRSPSHRAKSSRDSEFREDKARARLHPRIVSLFSSVQTLPKPVRA